MAAVTKGEIVLEQLSYSNPEFNPTEDLKVVALLVVCFAIVTPLLRRFILWPLARKWIVEPNHVKKQKIIELEEKAVLRNRGKKGNEGLGPESSSAISKSSDPSSDIDNVLRKIENKRVKFVVAETKLCFYMFFFAFSIWALQDQWDWFWDATKQHIIFDSVPWRLKALYFMETAYYLYTMVAMLFEPKMKDRNQMLSHHIFTLGLLATSYSWGTVKYGTAIMTLHDFSDPWMEAAKLFNYVGNKLGANVCFVVFATSFVYLRVYIFPRHIIAATFTHGRPTGYPYYWITFGLLGGLWVLHCFWSFLIFRVLRENILTGNSRGDVREEED